MSNTEPTFEEQHSNVIKVYHGSVAHREAHAGYVYQCQACGKRARDNFGTQRIDRGFDESCSLNCVLVKDDKP